MSPHEWGKYASARDRMLAVFGWTRKEVGRESERGEYDHTRYVTVWNDAAGNWLIDESDVEEDFYLALERVAGMKPLQEV